MFCNTPLTPEAFPAKVDWVLSSPQMLILIVQNTDCLLSSNANPESPKYRLCLVKKYSSCQYTRGGSLIILPVLRDGYWLGTEQPDWALQLSKISPRPGTE